MPLRNTTPVMHSVMSPAPALPAVAEDRIARFAAKLSNTWMWVGIGVAAVIAIAQS